MTVEFNSMIIQISQSDDLEQSAWNQITLITSQSHIKGKAWKDPT